MKLASTLLLLQATASAVHFRAPKTSLTEELSEANVGVFYGEPTPRHHAGEPDSNRTEAVAQMIAAEAGVEATFFEKPYSNYDFTEYDAIIVGSPTYNTGAWNYRSNTDWDDWLYDELPEIDLSNLKVAIFGTGNGFFAKPSKPQGYSGYGDMFGDALGEIYDRLSEVGCQMFGFTTANNDLENGGLNFTRSKFIRNGQFMGRMFDQHDEAQMILNPGRAKEWVEQLRDEGFFIKGAKKTM